MKNADVGRQDALDEIVVIRRRRRPNPLSVYVSTAASRSIPSTAAAVDARLLMCLLPTHHDARHYVFRLHLATLARQAVAVCRHSVVEGVSGVPGVQRHLDDRHRRDDAEVLQLAVEVQPPVAGQRPPEPLVANDLDRCDLVDGDTAVKQLLQGLRDVRTVGEAAADAVLCEAYVGR